MSEDVELFAAIAEIAGVFVGFGALISVTRRATAAPSDRIQIRGTVVTGLIVIVAALIPIGLARYSLEPSTVWRFSSFAFLLLIWVSFLQPLRNPRNRAEAVAQFKGEPVGLVFLLALEVVGQGPLVLVLLGQFPASWPALYTTALIINLLQAAFFLSRLVLSSPERST